MLKFLKKPYPAHTTNWSNLYIALGVGLFVAIFLVWLEPFGLDEFRGDYRSLRISVFGLLSFIGVGFFNFVLPRLFPSITDDKTWTVGKEILWLNGMLLMISLLNSLYNPTLSSTNQFNFPSFLFMCFNTFTLGSIPSAFLVALDHNRLFRKYRAESDSIRLPQETINSPLSVSTKKITIPIDGNEISFDPSNFLYAESMGNYANIILYKGDQLQKDLYRSTLKNLEENIDVKGILRCHRSYIVNLEQVKEVSGNAQGFKLSLKFSDEIIPVSRKYVPIVKAYFN